MAEFKQIDLFAILPNYFVENIIAQVDNFDALFDANITSREVLLDNLRLGINELFKRQVYVTGSNEDGQLGTGDRNNKSRPILIDIVDDNNNKVRIKQISAGDDHTMFLTVNGQVYATGSNEFGQLGYDGTNGVDKPILINVGSRYDSDVRIKQIAAGSVHTIFLSEEGKVYATGYNGYGQLGYDSDNIYTPILIDIVSNDNNDDTRVKQIAAGGFHTMFLIEDGQVYATGSNEFGQLGYGSTGTAYNPILIEIGSSDTNNSNVKIKQIVAGIYHTMFLMEDGQVYATGYGIDGQLGYGGTDNQLTPILINFDRDDIIVKQIAAGGFHTMFLTEDGKVYATGNNLQGELGYCSIDDQHTPILINICCSDSDDNLKIKQIAAGGFHTMFLTEDGRVYATGEGQYCRLGTGEESAQFTPTLIDVNAEKVKQITAGSKHTMF